MNARRPRLLLGVGNVLRRDDGVGVFAARAAARLRLGRGVEAYDGGSGGIDLADVLEGRRRVVIVDAIDAGMPPGASARMSPEQLRPAIRTGVSLHDLHLLDALAELRLLRLPPRRVIVIGVQVADISVGIGLSPPVERALPGVIRSALRELGLPAPAAIPFACDALVPAAADEFPGAGVEIGSWKSK